MNTAVVDVDLTSERHANVVGLALLHSMVLDIYMAGNQLCPSGATAFAKLLKKNTTITVLDLSREFSRAIFRVLVASAGFVFRLYHMRARKFSTLRGRN